MFFIAEPIRDLVSFDHISQRFYPQMIHMISKTDKLNNPKYAV